MKSWTRWQDWVALVAGAYLALSPIWVAHSSGALVTSIALGALLAVGSLWSLAMPTSISSEWAHAVLGVVTFVAPWVIGYSDLSGPAWTSWIVGLIGAVLGISALVDVRQTTQVSAH